MVSEQMKQWGEQLASTTSLQDKRALAALINSYAAVLNTNGLFDLVMAWLRGRKINTEIPPALRDELKTDDKKRHGRRLETLMEILAAQILAGKQAEAAEAGGDNLKEQVTCICTNVKGCASQHVYKASHPPANVPPCYENLPAPDPEYVLTELLKDIEAWRESNREGGARPAAASVAEVLLRLTQGSRRWMNLGEQDREDFFEKVAGDIVGKALGPRRAKKTKSLKSIKHLMERTLGDIDEYLLRDAQENNLIPKSNGAAVQASIALKLAEIARTGKVQTIDDAFFVADELVSDVAAQQAPRG
ncbi:unnamed protein product, partial [Mesorhabditis spiculigera]